jgi:protein-S-isoprenylcysteine O-methyltransferase Ste14
MTADTFPQRKPMASPLDNRIPPPVVMLATSIAMGAASFVTPAIPLPEAIRFGLAGVVLLAGGVFGARAFAAFGRAKTTINPVDIEAASSLVTAGVYGVTRNPMYVALTALLVALALLLSNAWLLVGPAFFVAFTTRFQIIPEERVMRAKFGEAYASYARSVRRWL